MIQSISFFPDIHEDAIQKDIAKTIDTCVQNGTIDALFYMPESIEEYIRSNPEEILRHNKKILKMAELIPNL
jgi:hypothetical protein